MPTKRVILSELIRDELRDNLDVFELEVDDRRVTSQLIDALAGSRKSDSMRSCRTCPAAARRSCAERSTSMIQAGGRLISPCASSAQARDRRGARGFAIYGLLEQRRPMADTRPAPAALGLGDWRRGTAAIFVFVAPDELAATARGGRPVPT